MCSPRKSNVTEMKCLFSEEEIFAEFLVDEHAELAGQREHRA